MFVLKETFCLIQYEMRFLNFLVFRDERVGNIDKNLIATASRIPVNYSLSLQSLLLPDFS